MLYLNNDTVNDLVDTQEAIDLMEKVMVAYEEGNYIMPKRLRISRSNHNYLYMPYISEEVCGSKMQTIYPDNKKLGLPAIYGMVMLNDTKTGKIDCLLDGEAITSMRAAAVSAVGVKYTTPETIESVGVIGASLLAFYQLVFTCKVRSNIKHIYIYDLYPDAALELKKYLETEIVKYKELEYLKDLSIQICSEPIDLVASSDLVITTTYSTTPVIPDNPDLFKNKHFIGVGSYRPDMREFPDALFTQVKQAYTDVYYAKEETGDLIDPIDSGILAQDDVYTLGNVIRKLVPPVDTSKATFYKIVGMAMFDIELANYLYHKALDKKVGQHLVE